jgi:hypothetical protein
MNKNTQLEAFQVCSAAKGGAVARKAALDKGPRGKLINRIAADISGLIIKEKLSPYAALVRCVLRDDGHGHDAQYAEYRSNNLNPCTSRWIKKVLPVRSWRSGGQMHRLWVEPDAGPRCHWGQVVVQRIFCTTNVVQEAGARWVLLWGAMMAGRLRYAYLPPSQSRIVRVCLESGGVA